MIFLRLFSIWIGVSSVLACSNINQNSLLTNEATKATGSAISKVANSADLNLTVNSPAQGFSVGGGDHIELSGTCFASTYPISKIIAVLDKKSLTVVNLYNGNDQDHFCIQGRFNIILQASELTASNGNNNVKVSLVALDSSRRAATSPVSASRSISIYK